LSIMNARPVARAAACKLNSVAAFASSAAQNHWAASTAEQETVDELLLSKTRRERAAHRFDAHA